MKAFLRRLPAFLLALLISLTIFAGPPARAASASGHGAAASAPPPSMTSVAIPGALRSFLRMAAISQKVSPERVLPLLARNVVMEGYGWSGKSPQPSEYLILLRGYLEHARALLSLAGPSGVIRVADCGAAGPLLKVLGYKLLKGCGPNATVETADAKQAFLTIDSGFPLTNFVDALRANKPFVFPVAMSRAPVLFNSSDWVDLDVGRRHVSKGKYQKLPHDAIDSLVDDPTLARLYWALSRMDTGTRDYLERTVGLAKLLPYAPVLDFYGGGVYIRSGHVAVPGGLAADHAWAKLVGANPNDPAKFIVHLVSKDDGWLAAYYSALARLGPRQQAYYTSGHRLKEFYEALRGRNPRPGAARPVFRPDPNLVLLVSGLRIGPSGAPLLPGTVAVWKRIMSAQIKNHSSVIREVAAGARRWRRPDQVVAAMFAMSRDNSMHNPLNLFLAINDVDAPRPAEEKLSSGAVLLLARNYAVYGDQYGIFAEFDGLSGASMARYFSTADSLDRIRQRTLRADAVGIFQANLGLWQIFTRQEEIPAADENRSWNRVIGPFYHVHNAGQVLAATRKSLTNLLLAAGYNGPMSQQEIIDLLAGPVQSSAEGQTVRQDIAYRIGSVMVAQRLMSLDTLFGLASGLNAMAHGKAMPADLPELAGELRELPMPKPLFTNSERAEWSYGPYIDPHIQEEASANFVKVIRGRHSSQKLEQARGLVVPFLRDTLVGLNYAYYQPPGAQALYYNPLFVRYHDFIGTAISGKDQSWKTPVILGRGWTASGGARLEGSLANLPYVLSEVDEDFIAPRNVQALIWEDLVGTLLTNAVVPRWWNVSPAEMHAVALYQEYGDELVAAAAGNGELRQQVMELLASREVPRQLDAVGEALSANAPKRAQALLAPSDLFFLATDYMKRFPAEASKWGKAGAELESLAASDPDAVNLQKISRDFGVPHPALADTYAPALLNLKPFPTYLGYSSRLLAESWESNNLYWARLADEAGDPPVMLNLLVPQLTRQMISRIFATDLEDRPAMLRALWATGAAFTHSHAPHPAVRMAEQIVQANGR